MFIFQVCNVTTHPPLMCQFRPLSIDSSQSTIPVDWLTIVKWSKLKGLCTLNLAYSFLSVVCIFLSPFHLLNFKMTPGNSIYILPECKIVSFFPGLHSILLSSLSTHLSLDTQVVLDLVYCRVYSEFQYRTYRLQFYTFYAVGFLYLVDTYAFGIFIYFIK